MDRWINRSEQILLSQQPHRRGDDRERINRARQTAEALFTPKRQVTEQLVSGFPPADQSARKPRVLGISPSAPNRLTPKFRSFDLNDFDHQWLASHLRF